MPFTYGNNHDEHLSAHMPQYKAAIQSDNYRLSDKLYISPYRHVAGRLSINKRSTTIADDTKKIN